MKSPFPGMDPYLEGYLWPDVHNALAYKIRQQIIPKIRPKYVARINTYVVEDNSPENDLGIMYPDVEVMFKKARQAAGKQPALVLAGAFEEEEDEAPKTPDPVGFSAPYITSIEVRIPVVEIRDTENNRLVTCIEILSPVNKRKPGLGPYLEKRRKLHDAGVHFLEIDLLRRGNRTIRHRKLATVEYLVGLTRGSEPRTDIWPISLRSPLPVVPVPLLEPDKDVTLDIQKVFQEVYKDAAYELSIDYADVPPPPVFSEEDLAWMKGLG